MAEIKTNSCEMYDGKVVVHKTTNSNYPGEVLYEFRMYPDINKGEIRNPFAWNDDDPFNETIYDIPRTLVLPLRDLDVLTMKDLHRMKMTEDRRIELDGRFYEGIHWNRHGFNTCVDLEHQIIKNPYPVPPEDRQYSEYVRESPLMSFEEAKECLELSLNKNDGFFAFGNCVVSIVKPIDRFSLRGNVLYRNKSQFRPHEEFSNKLDEETIKAILYHVSILKTEIAKSCHRRHPRVAHFYKCVQIIYNIEDANLDEESAEFVAGVADFLDFYKYMIEKLGEKRAIKYNENYGTNFETISKEFCNEYLYPSIFDHHVWRVLKLNLHKEPLRERVLGMEEYNFLHAAHYYVMRKGKKLIKKLNYNKIKEAIEDPYTDYEVLTNITERCYDKIGKKHKKTLNKKIKKINRKREKADFSDWIGSPRVSKEAKFIRIMSVFKKLLPMIITTAVTAAVGAILKFFKIEAPAPSLI